jgi:hypothetical protein
MAKKNRNPRDLQRVKAKIRAESENRHARPLLMTASLVPKNGHVTRDGKEYITIRAGERECGILREILYVHSDFSAFPPGEEPPFPMPRTAADRALRRRLLLKEYLSYLHTSHDRIITRQVPGHDGEPWFAESFLEKINRDNRFVHREWSRIPVADRDRVLCLQLWEVLLTRAKPGQNLIKILLDDLATGVPTQEEVEAEWDRFEEA